VRGLTDAAIGDTPKVMRDASENLGQRQLGDELTWARRQLTAGVSAACLRGWLGEVARR